MKNSSKLIVVAGVGVVVLTGVVTLAWTFSGPPAPTGLHHEPNASPSALPSSRQPGADGVDDVRPGISRVASGTRSARLWTRPQPPAALADFYAWDAGVQLNRITELQADAHLDLAILGFLSQAINDPALDETLRNNMANCLLNQVQPDPYLHRRFIAMINDPQESYTWRIYAVQHLAVCMATSAKPRVIVDTLQALMRRGEPSIAGTAMLHLHRLEQQGLIGLNRGFTTDLLAMLDDPKGDLLNRMTALGLLGERQERSSLPVVRRFAACETPSLRRVAIAVLGQIGDAEDRALIHSAQGESDPGATAAAHAALASIDQRQPTSDDGR